MVSHTPAIFGGHRYYGSGEMVLVCHVLVTTLPSLVVLHIEVVQI